MSATPPFRSYYPALDGLRGVGCLLVVLYHNFWFLHGYFFFGWLAVDIFFVLSGYLITSILIRSQHKKNFLGDFYARRIRRIFPLYYATLVLFLLVLPFVPGLPFRLDFYVTHQAWFWAFLQNWLLIFRDPGGQNALNHLWSLAVEEQFYLAWPLLFVLIRKPKTLVVVTGALLLAFSAFRFWIWMNPVSGISYYNFFFFTRIDGLCIGCMVALLQQIHFRLLGRHTALVVFGFAVINFAFYFLNLRHNDTFPYLGLVGFSTFSMLFGLLVDDLTTRPKGFFHSIFNQKLLKWCGKVSFGTYVFHWPVYLLLQAAIEKNIPLEKNDSFTRIIIAVLATVLAFAVGWLSYRYFESLFRKRTTLAEN